MKRDVYLSAIKDSGYKITHVAKTIGVSRTHFSRWLNGHQGSLISNSHLDQLEKLLRM